MNPKNATRVLCCLLVIAIFTQISCDRPDAVTSTVEDTAANEAKHVTANEETPTEELAKERVRVPPPTPKLLRTAKSVTVRLGNSQFDGSGVIIHRDDHSLYILTVAHAVRETIDRVEIFERGDTPIAELRQVKVLSQLERADLALIQVEINDEIETTTVRIAKLVDKDPQPAFGYSVGCGGGKPPSTHREHILGAGSVKLNLESGSVTRYMWRTEMPQEKGRSGGPLLDVNGNLLGIALGKYEDNGYYAHLREISEYLIDSGLAPLLEYVQPSHVDGQSQGNR